jgi:hypothetical protein
MPFNVLLASLEDDKRFAHVTLGAIAEKLSKVGAHISIQKWISYKWNDSMRDHPNPLPFGTTRRTCEVAEDLAAWEKEIPKDQKEKAIFIVDLKPTNLPASGNPIMYGTQVISEYAQIIGTDVLTLLRDENKVVAFLTNYPEDLGKAIGGPWKSFMAKISAYSVTDAANATRAAKSLLSRSTTNTPITLFAGKNDLPFLADTFAQWLTP